jgi:hypothetical protein
MRIVGCQDQFHAQIIAEFAPFRKAKEVSKHLFLFICFFIASGFMRVCRYGIMA